MSTIEFNKNIENHLCDILHRRHPMWFRVAIDHDRTQ